MITLKPFVHVVAAIIKNDKDEYLCALRGSNMSLPSYWEFPGGKIEEGESKKEALKREIKEELKCEIDVLERVEDTIYSYETSTVRLETFMATLVHGEPINTEHAEIRWVPKEKLLSLNWAPADIPAVRKVVST